MKRHPQGTPSSSLGWKSCYNSLAQPVPGRSCRDEIPARHCSRASWLAALPAIAPASKADGKNRPTAPAAPVYKEESPLPKGWPEPGPYNQVARKKYPAYRAAFTTDSSPNGVSGGFSSTSSATKSP